MPTELTALQGHRIYAIRFADETRKQYVFKDQYGATLFVVDVDAIFDHSGNYFSDRTVAEDVIEG